MKVSFNFLLFLLVSATPVLSHSKCEDHLKEREEEKAEQQHKFTSIIFPCCSCQNNGSCSCHNVSNDALIICGIQCANFSILDCYCATYNENKRIIEVGQYPYNCARYKGSVE